jgi:excisionase family DNA binding protein
MTAALTPRYLTRADVAAYLSVSPNTVSRMVDAGTLPAPIKLNGTMPRWDREAIDASLQSKRRGVIEDPAAVDDLIRTMRGRRRDGRKAA